MDSRPIPAPAPPQRIAKRLSSLKDGGPNARVPPGSVLSSGRHCWHRKPQIHVDAVDTFGFLSLTCVKAGVDARRVRSWDVEGRLGRWRRGAITGESSDVTGHPLWGDARHLFVRGYWFAPAHPPMGPGLLEPLRFGLRRLYELRLDVDYDAVPISRASAETGMQTVQRTLAESDQRTQGGRS